MHSDLDALSLLRQATTKHGIHLSVLVAETALWAPPEVFRRLKVENGSGCYFPNTRRAKAGAGEKPSQVLNGERLDSNAYANHAAKRAVGLGRGAIGFEVCHIWSRSCYDARYHTCVANLVLLPRQLAGLTDHDAEIGAALRFRAFELYGWYPAEEPAPAKPEFYPTEWRDPEPFTPAIALALARRRAEIPLTDEIET
jgi:hypothetical protein